MVTRITSTSAVSRNGVVWILCVGLLLLLLPVSLFAGEKYRGEIGGLAIEVVSDVPVSYIWHSRTQSVLHDSQGVVVSFFPSGAESVIQKDGRSLLGVAMVGLGDVAESPVAFLVWGHGEDFADDMSSRYVRRNGKVALFFLPAGCADILRCQDAVLALPIDVSGDGESVHLAGIPIGKIGAP